MKLFRSGLLFCASLLMLGAVSCSSTGSSSGPAVVENRGTIAVMSFESVGADQNLGTVVSEIVRTEISSMKPLPYTVLERMMLDRLIKEHELSMTGLIDPSQTSTVGKMLYAEYLLYGKIINTGNGYRISASITETNTGKVYRTEYEDVRNQNGIPIAARTLSYRLFDRKLDIVEPETGSESNDYASIYSDSQGIHRGGVIHLEFKGETVEGYTVEDAGRAEMTGTVNGDLINGYYKASYGYGNYSFRILDGGKYLVGTYYQVSNGAHGDWIATKGTTFSMPRELYTGKWRPGDRCLVQWSGDSYWYPAKIGNIGDGLYFIRYDDGDTEWRMERYIKKEEIREGDVVFCNWQGKGRYYRGVIAKRDGDRIFMKYDDGDEEWTSIGRVRLR